MSETVFQSLANVQVCIEFALKASSTDMPFLVLVLVLFVDDPQRLPEKILSYRHLQHFWYCKAIAVRQYDTESKGIPLVSG